VAFIQFVGYGMVILLQSKLELLTAPNSISPSVRRWAGALLEFEAIRNLTENALGPQGQDPTLSLSHIISPLYSDRRHHLEHDLISLILAVPQVEAIQLGYMHFFQNFLQLGYMHFFQNFLL